MAQHSPMAARRLAGAPTRGIRGRLRNGLLAAALIAWLTPLGGQQLLDRVVARVGTIAITLSDVQAAIGLGLVERAASTEAAAVQPLIDRQLVLMEAARFPPPDPTPAAIEARVASMKAHAGADLERLMRTTGVDEPRLRDLARDTLRIQGYIDQRFGVSVQVTEDDARRYYDAHPEEFRSGGLQVPFDQAEPEARRRASEERLRATVERWLEDLRARADIVVAPPIG